MLPAPHTVEHRSATRSGENALGQAVATYTTRQRNVYGWSPQRNDDGNTADLAGRVITELDLLTPDPDWGDGDIVVIPGRGEFVVVGGVDDFGAGPFGFAPGYRVRIRQVTDNG